MKKTTLASGILFGTQKSLINKSKALWQQLERTSNQVKNTENLSRFSHKASIRLMILGLSFITLGSKFRRF